MWPSVRLPRTHPENLPNPTLCDDLPSFHDARRKDLGFGIAMHSGRTSSSPEHGMRLPRRARQRFRAYLISLGTRKRQRNREMLFVRNGDDVEVDIVSLYKPAELYGWFRNRPFLGELPGAVFLPGIIRDNLLASDIGKTLHVKARDEPGSQHCDTNARLALGHRGSDSLSLFHPFP